MAAKTYIVMPGDKEIDEVLNRCADAENDGRSEYPGMTYEQGLRVGIEWVLGIGDEPPFEDI